jgi:hypothetical protein
MDTLAVRRTIPPVGFAGDFHSQVRAPCRAHNEKGGHEAALGVAMFKLKLMDESDCVVYRVLEYRTV